MRRGAVILIALMLSGLCHAQRPVDCVDPFIGTTNFGTCNPGAVCPHGMMSVVPFNVMGSAANRYDKDARWWSTPY
ncbi:MAG: glycoside hydrolase family 92 protein, partial [Alistipes sp.]|nr:glycoside hydrolase family 92 protein [Alistipes sp.]